MDRRRYFDIMGAAPTAVTVVTTVERRGEPVRSTAGAARPLDGGDGPDRPDDRPAGSMAGSTRDAGGEETSTPGVDPPMDGESLHAGCPVGLTVSAVTSVSAEPPILAVCLDRRSRTLPVIERTRRFAVNFLRGDRGALAARFAAPGIDRFAGVRWRPGTTGVPILVDDAIAHAECLVEGSIAVGDHVVVLGRVVDGAPPAPGSRPLMYFRHGFSAWAGPVEDAQARPTPSSLATAERRAS